MSVAPLTGGARTERGITIGGIGTVVAIVASAVAVLMWLGFSPGQQLARSEADATYERKAEAKIMYDVLGGSIERMSDKLDAMIQVNPRAQERLDMIIQRRGKR